MGLKDCCGAFRLPLALPLPLHLRLRLHLAFTDLHGPVLCSITKSMLTFFLLCSHRQAVCGVDRPGHLLRFRADACCCMITRKTNPSVRMYMTNPGSCNGRGSVMGTLLHVIAWEWRLVSRSSGGSWLALSRGALGVVGGCL